MDILEQFVQQNLNLYSQDGVSILCRLIDLYKDEQRDCDKSLECICEVFDDFKLSLTFMNFPDMGNYGQVLSDEDQLFMMEPKFLNNMKEKEVLKNMRSYLISNDINEDEYDVYDEISSKVVPEWLAECWVAANKIRRTKFNLFCFSHRYFNEPVINLINQETLFLKDLKYS
ncbi:hypothetical protein J7J47_14320 [Halomonas sp. ISL-60]|uniref:hypothetical protein n=1 Tax=Halomonas sp. ISL-56 TaxID=2819149 RepID=UPI001BEB074E|nr:hypothetical protein [Halomonas sp. ISL-56]MBT2773399.1 hypothetical protein [Halomonas sp. ISL-60]MBT2802063.1 hypothetical protein [Halomonas sp. ISL-56]